MKLERHAKTGSRSKEEVLTYLEILIDQIQNEKVRVHLEDQELVRASSDFDDLPHFSAYGKRITIEVIYPTPGPIHGH